MASLEATPQQTLEQLLVADVPVAAATNCTKQIRPAGSPVDADHVVVFNIRFQVLEGQTSGVLVVP